jgi:AmmeMemoRadiSam system protein A
MSHNRDEQREMVALARDSIMQGLSSGHPLSIDLQQQPAYLQQNGACFVTLEIDKRLRGCIGSLQAYRPLAEDLVQNAFAAAFRDPRFAALGSAEFPQTHIKLSLLSAAEPMQFDSEEDLLRQLLPGVDGLILNEGLQRGTFLPSVWEQLPDPAQFLSHLKQKAGLPANYWSKTIQIERYRTEQFS